MRSNKGGVIFYRKNKDDRVLWVSDPDDIGTYEFSFDKKKIYNLFQDYPMKLSAKEREIFDAENPFWVEFFKDRRGSA